MYSFVFRTYLDPPDARFKPQLFHSFLGKNQITAVGAVVWHFIQMTVPSKQWLGKKRRTPVLRDSTAPLRAEQLLFYFSSLYEETRITHHVMVHSLQPEDINQKIIIMYAISARAVLSYVQNISHYYTLHSFVALDLWSLSHTSFQKTSYTTVCFWLCGNKFKEVRQMGQVLVKVSTSFWLFSV